MEFPRIIISSDRSNSGKTLITAGLIKALSKKYKIRAYKAGPDFIDPMYLKVASGYPAINLDLWLMGEDGVIKTLSKYAKGFELGVIEGVMGLYDGVGIKYSTYEISQVTKTPILLIINCSNIGSTAAAIVKGLKEYKKANIRGVIFNFIGSDAHLNYCKESIETEVIGYVKYDKKFIIPSRHLGLFTVDDFRQTENIINEIAKEIERNVDLDLLLEIAKESPPIPQPEEEETDLKKGKAYIALDSAFNFYYEDNINFLRKKFEVEFFSPLNNDIPKEDAEVIYIGGGYPELHLEELEKATGTKKWILRNIEAGKKVIAECGGLMYLSKELVSPEEKSYRMVEAFDISIRTKDKLTIGYTELEGVRDSFIAKRGDTIRGHEFHVSKPINVNDVTFAFRNKIGKGIWEGRDGAVVNNTIALYSHLYFSSIRGLSF
ncbi:MAG: cobyrinate a,c-diamide synthase [Sulfolobaceae archaeon]|jgi:cobyrinic acid a,c-diamide synthase